MKQKTFQGKPLYNMEIDEEKGFEGMDMISLVKNPATEKPFFKFKKEEKEKEFSFAVASEDKQLLTGVVMLADTPIYRRAENGEEFFVQFPKPIVEKMAFKYMKDQFTKNVNLEHSENAQVEGVYLVESYLFDEERGIKIPEFIGEVPPGSWIATFKVDNPEVWEKVKKGEFEGFSLEGDFDTNMAFTEIKPDNKFKSLILDENSTENEIYNAIIKEVSNA
jgi:predicted glutamine amidotransferase